MPGARTVHNRNLGQGAATSLAVGLGYLGPTCDAGGVGVLAVEMVGVTGGGGCGAPPRCGSFQGDNGP